jgi:intraflagellar transport protein 140
VKQTLGLTESEGSGQSLMVVSARYLVTLTSNRVVKIWDVSKREARLHAHPIHLAEKIPNLLSTVKEAKLNASGTRLSVVASASPTAFDSRIYVLDLEGNRVSYFNFDSGKADRDDVSVPPNSAQSTGSTTSSATERGGNHSHLLGKILY